MAMEVPPERHQAFTAPLDLLGPRARQRFHADHDSPRGPRCQVERRRTRPGHGRAELTTSPAPPRKRPRTSVSARAAVRG
jgi:hypothetical protein